MSDIIIVNSYRGLPEEEINKYLYREKYVGPASGLAFSAYLYGVIHNIILRTAHFPIIHGEYKDKQFK